MDQIEAAGLQQDIYGQVLAKRDLLEKWQSPKFKRGSLDIVQKQRELAALERVLALLKELQSNGYFTEGTDKGGVRRGAEARTEDAPRRLSEVDQVGADSASGGGAPDKDAQRGFAGF